MRVEPQKLAKKLGYDVVRRDRQFWYLRRSRRPIMVGPYRTESLASKAAVGDYWEAAHQNCASLWSVN